MDKEKSNTLDEIQKNKYKKQITVSPDAVLAPEYLSLEVQKILRKEFSKEFQDAVFSIFPEKCFIKK